MTPEQKQMKYISCIFQNSPIETFLMGGDSSLWKTYKSTHNIIILVKKELKYEKNCNFWQPFCHCDLRRKTKNSTWHVADLIIIMFNQIIHCWLHCLQYGICYAGHLVFLHTPEVCPQSH
jgi:hypothetical protein